MAKIYGTTEVPSDYQTVDSGDSVAVSRAFLSTVGIVGGMDAANGSANTGDVKEVNSTSDAQDYFGENSELARLCADAFEGGFGASKVYAVGVPETDDTYQSSSDETIGTLANAPFFDPNVHPDESVTATDDASNSIDVNVVYENASPNAPSESDTINLDHQTGQWTADASDTYTINYTYGDYTQAIQDVALEDIRYLIVASEDHDTDGHIDTALDEANDRDDVFDFFRVIAGVEVGIGNPSSYSHGFDDQRLALTIPRGDDGDGNKRRTYGSVAGKLAGKELGDSTTYENLYSIENLKTDYDPAELGDLADAGVMPLEDTGANVRVVKDMTTSTDPKFERVFQVEIVDEVSEQSHVTAEQYIGELNTEDNREDLRDAHNAAYEAMKVDEPPLLDDYTVSVSEGSNDDEVDVAIGVDLVDIMDTINVDITVGTVVINEGAS